MSAGSQVPPIRQAKSSPAPACNCGRSCPHPSTGPNGEQGIAEGRHAIIINVFTEPQWRRRGLAALLMQHIIDWSRQKELDRLVLHASDEGRALYEKLGFALTSEMKFVGNE